MPFLTVHAYSSKQLIKKKPNDPIYNITCSKFLPPETDILSPRAYLTMSYIKQAENKQVSTDFPGRYFSFY